METALHGSGGDNNDSGVVLDLGEDDGARLPSRIWEMAYEANAAYPFDIGSAVALLQRGVEQVQVQHTPTVLEIPYQRDILRFFAKELIYQVRHHGKMALKRELRDFDPTDHRPKYVAEGGDATAVMEPSAVAPPNSAPKPRRWGHGTIAKLAKLRGSALLTTWGMPDGRSLLEWTGIELGGLVKRTNPETDGVATNNYYYLLLSKRCGAKKVVTTSEVERAALFCKAEHAAKMGRRAVQKELGVKIPAPAEDGKDRKRRKGA